MGAGETASEILDRALKKPLDVALLLVSAIGLGLCLVTFVHWKADVPFFVEFISPKNYDSKQLVAIIVFIVPLGIVSILNRTRVSAAPRPFALAPDILTLFPAEPQRLQSHIEFLLRGARETYLRGARRENGEIEIAMRIDVMLPDKADEAIAIEYCDYLEHFTDAERKNRWLKHEGQCGRAWATGHQEFYLADVRSPKSEFHAMGSKAGELQLKMLDSVLSTPVFWNQLVIGVLNVDSQQANSATRFMSDATLRVFRDCAECLAPLLQSRRATSEAHAKPS